MSAASGAACVDSPLPFDRLTFNSHCLASLREQTSHIVASTVLSLRHLDAGGLACSNTYTGILRQAFTDLSQEIVEFAIEALERRGGTIDSRCQIAFIPSATNQLIPLTAGAFRMETRGTFSIFASREPTRAPGIHESELEFDPVGFAVASTWDGKTWSDTENLVISKNKVATEAEKLRIAVERWTRERDRVTGHLLQGVFKGFAESATWRNEGENEIQDFMSTVERLLPGYIGETLKAAKFSIQVEDSTDLWLPARHRIPNLQVVRTSEHRVSVTFLYETSYKCGNQWVERGPVGMELTFAKGDCGWICGQVSTRDESGEWTVKDGLVKGLNDHGDAMDTQRHSVARVEQEEQARPQDLSKGMDNLFRRLESALTTSHRSSKFSIPYNDTEGLLSVFRSEFDSIAFEIEDWFDADEQGHDLEHEMGEYQFGYQTDHELKLGAGGLRLSVQVFREAFHQGSASSRRLKTVGAVTHALWTGRDWTPGETRVTIDD